MHFEPVTSWWMNIPRATWSETIKRRWQHVEIGHSAPSQTSDADKLSPQKIDTQDREPVALGSTS
jgi:hypothetical protein